jgi:hypothetical protein
MPTSYNITFSWYKLWHGAHTAPKWLMVADTAGSTPLLAMGTFFSALDYASEQEDRGSVAGFRLELVASFFRAPLDEVRRVFDALCEFGLIVGGRIAKWEIRQVERAGSEEGEENPSTIRVRRWRARRLELGLPISGWEVTRLRIFERDGYTCRYCGAAEGPFHRDHVLPRSRGGTDHDDNLMTACAFCNGSKGDKTIEEWRASGLAPAGVLP